MAQTLTRILIHVIFSTKQRELLIDESLEQRLFAYMGKVASNLDSPILTINGCADHVHLLVSLSKKVALSDLMLPLKRDSSYWVNDQPGAQGHFGWQDGYAAFSIGESQVPTLCAYIANQKAHHQKVSFQDELRAFFKKYGIAYDERYIWT